MLDDNKIGAEGTQELCNALVKNVKLATLGISKLLKLMT